MAPSPHQQRLLTGLALTAFLAACLVFQGVLTFLAILFFSLWGMWEFLGLFWGDRPRLGGKVVGAALAVGLVFASWNGRLDLAAGAVIAGFWAAALLFLLDEAGPHTPGLFGEYLALPMALVYVPVSLQFFFRFATSEAVLVLGAAFLSDTAAYYTGVHFGRRKLWPRVSPKKTWEGSLGSLTACLLVVLALGLLFGKAPWWAFLLLGIPLNAAAQAGDLVESAIKRSLEVKDSGTLLPGHGGLLDRIDALLFVVPVYAACRLAVDFF